MKMKRMYSKRNGETQKKARQQQRGITDTDTLKIPDKTEGMTSRDRALSLLRKHPGIPANFKVIAIVQSDENTLEAVRQSLKPSKRSAALSIVFFPVALPMALLRREERMISKRLTDGAEDDVYVVGTHGFVTLNRGNVKAYTPARAMILEEDKDLFKSEKSGAMWGKRSTKAQSILVVHDEREDFPPQICFVSKKDMSMIFARSRKYGVDSAIPTQ